MNKTSTIFEYCVFLFHPWVSKSFHNKYPFSIVTNNFHPTHFCSVYSSAVYFYFIYYSSVHLCSIYSFSVYLSYTCFYFTCLSPPPSIASSALYTSISASISLSLSLLILLLSLVLALFGTGK